MCENAFGPYMKRLSQLCLILFPWGITASFQIIMAKFIIEILYDNFKFKFFDSQEKREN
jgi:hypothetical protein